jgi:hypothetical protein
MFFNRYFAGLLTVVSAALLLLSAQLLGQTTANKCCTRARVDPPAAYGCIANPLAPAFCIPTGACGQQVSGVAIPGGCSDSKTAANCNLGTGTRAVTTFSTSCPILGPCACELTMIGQPTNVTVADCSGTACPKS